MRLEHETDKRFGDLGIRCSFPSLRSRSRAGMIHDTEHGADAQEPQRPGALSGERFALD